MTAADDLDYAPLGAHTGLRSRMRAIGSNPLMEMGATIGVLLVLVPLVVSVALVATGNLSDPGAAACLVMLVAGGIYTCWSVQRESAKAGAFGLFATVNGLTWVHGTTATQYAGSEFADGSHIVNQSVRTPDTDFLEVGDRFTVTRPGLPRGAVGAGLGGRAGVPLTGTASPYRSPQVFLRARLAGGATGAPGDGVLVTPELRAAIEDFAGDHVVELTASELTVLGSRPLGVDDPVRVRRAFELVEELAAMNARSPRASGATQAATEDRAAARHPFRVVLAVLALMVVGPVVIALVMSSLEDVIPMRGNRALAGVVVLGIVAVVLVVVMWVMRRLVSPRRAFSGRGDEQPDEDAEAAQQVGGAGLLEHRDQAAPLGAPEHGAGGAGDR